MPISFIDDFSSLQVRSADPTVHAEKEGKERQPRANSDDEETQDGDRSSATSTLLRQHVSCL